MPRPAPTAVHAASYGGADDGQADMDTLERAHTSAGRARDAGRIRLAMSPHATDTCGPDLLRARAARARELNIHHHPPISHKARPKSRPSGARHGGRTPAEFLDWLGLMGPDLMAAHCIACTDGDLKLMAARGATVLNCPRVLRPRASPRHSAASAIMACAPWSAPTATTWTCSANSTRPR